MLDSQEVTVSGGFSGNLAYDPPMMHGGEKSPQIRVKMSETGKHDLSGRGNSESVSIVLV